MNFVSHPTRVEPHQTRAAGIIFKRGFNHGGAPAAHAHSGHRSANTNHRLLVGHLILRFQNGSLRQLAFVAHWKVAHHIARGAQFKGVQALNQARGHARNFPKRGLGGDHGCAALLSHLSLVRLLVVLDAVQNIFMIHNHSPIHFYNHARTAPTLPYDTA